ncbi:hypothetical protein BDV40DRAFT_268678, partial [Aspergillus tamarii]
MPSRACTEGVKEYRNLSMFYHPHGQAVRNSIIEFGRTDILWTREKTLDYWKTVNQSFLALQTWSQYL